MVKEPALVRQMRPQIFEGRKNALLNLNARPITTPGPDAQSGEAKTGRRDAPDLPRIGLAIRERAVLHKPRVRIGRFPEIQEAGPHQIVKERICGGDSQHQSSYAGECCASGDDCGHESTIQTKRLEDKMI
jgi:hypothetical protein